MAKKKYRKVSEVPSRSVTVSKGQTPRDTWKVHHNGKVHTFYSADDAQRFVDELQRTNPNYHLEEWEGNPSMKPEPAPETPTRQLHFASEDLPVYTPAQGNTPFERMMNAKIAGNSEANRRYKNAFYGMSDWDSLFGKARVDGVRRAWERNPEAMQLWTDAGNIAGAFAAAPFLAYSAVEAAPYLWQGGKWLWNASQPWFRAASRPMTTLAENWLPSAVPAAQVADLAIPASFAAPGVVNTYEGIRDGNLSQALWGASDIAMSLPFLQEARGANTLLNGRNAYSGTTSLLDAFFFNPTARSAATAAAVGMPFVAAANTPSGPQYEVEVDENGEVKHDASGNPVYKMRDPNGPYDPSNFIPKPTGFLENFWGFAKENPVFTGIALTSAIGGVRGGYRWGRNKWGKPEAPTRYSVTENGNEVWREWPSGSRPGESFRYEPATELPEGALPEGVVRPVEPAYPSRYDYGVTLDIPEVPRPVEFDEVLLPHPGSRPTGGNKKTLASRQAEWDSRNQAYSEQQERLRLHNEAQAEWDAYDAQAPERAAYNQAYNDWAAADGAYQADYERALQGYNDYMSAHPEQAPGYADWRAASDLWRAATGSKQWVDYQTALRKYEDRPELFKNPRRWLGRNWYVWSPAVAGTIWSGFNGIGGSHEYRPYSGGTGFGTINSVDTIGVVPGLQRDSVMNALLDSIRSYGSRPTAEPELVDDED